MTAGINNRRFNSRRPNEKSGWIYFPPCEPPSWWERQLATFILFVMNMYKSIINFRT